MSKKIKLILLYIAKMLGLFAFCRWCYRNRVRVLCYHGFSFDDEHLFRPKLFLTPATFGSRMRFLAKSDYNIVSLQEAIESKKPYQLVITIDDGWSGTYQLINSVLASHRFPIMLYVTSYYADKQIPVINVSLSYMLWKTKKKELNLSIPELFFNNTWQLDKINKQHLVVEVCKVIDKIESLNRRNIILFELSNQLEVSLIHEGHQLFRLLDIEELNALQSFNVDIQLHTHRHCSPSSEVELFQELNDNKSWLSKFQKPEDLRHFCFPSNEYHLDQINHLRKFGIRTAVTSNGGLFSRGDSFYLIPRILDGEDVSLIELEAELSGFMMTIKKFIRKI